MSSEETQRGVFPGSEFFTTLKKIAKKAMQEIHQINRELTTPSAVHEIQDGDLWTELHLGYNTAYNQSIGLQQSFSNEESIYNSLESFNSMIKWIKIETNRIEKQLQQFGYTPDNNTNYEYSLPLTPQQQEAIQNKNKQNQQMDVIQDNQENKMNNNHNHKSMDIDNENDSEDNEDEDIDIGCKPNLKQNQESDINEKNNKITLNVCSDAQTNNKESENNANTNSNSNSIINSSTNSTITSISSINITQKVQTLNTIIPVTPKTPALDDKFKMFYKNLRGKSGLSNERNQENEHKSNINMNINRNNFIDITNTRNSSESHPSSISAITPSVSTSVIPSKYSKYGDNILQTPLLSKKFDINAIRKMNNNNNNSHNDSNNSNLNDSLGSIPCLQSPKYRFKGSTYNNNNDNNDSNGFLNNNRNGTNPITPYQIRNNNINKTNDNMNHKIDTQTPITVSSFSLQRKQELSTMNDMNIDEIETSNDNNNKASFGMLYITENEFNGIPQWITNQIGSINEINKTIDVVNNKLKIWDGRISKAQFKELIGGNETPFILLLTRTNRLKTDWCQGNSVYCLP